MPVGVVQRARHTAHQLHRLLDAQLLFTPEPVAQGVALHERHDVIEVAYPIRGVGDPGIEEREDVRVLEVGGDLDLLEEPFGPDQRGQLGGQDLERHPAVVPEVVRQIDRGHPTLAQFALDAVAVLDGLRQVGEGIGHRGSSPRVLQNASERNPARAKPRGVLS